MARPKSKVSEQKERITLDGVTPGQFDQLLTLLTEWIRGGEVTVHIIVPHEVKLNFNEDKISNLLKENRIPSNCISQLRTDIPLMLQGILSGQRKVVARFIAENSAPPKAKGESKLSKEQVMKQVMPEVEARISCVEQKLVTADLRRQFAIKKAAKNNTYLGVYWDIVEKRGDSTGMMLPNLTSATVRIVAKKPSTSEEERFFFMPFVFPGMSVSNDEFVLTMTREDLRELIKELSNAEQAIGRTMEGE